MAGPDIPAQLQVLGLANENGECPISAVPFSERMAQLEDALTKLQAPTAA